MIGNAAGGGVLHFSPAGKARSPYPHPGSRSKEQDMRRRADHWEPACPGSLPMSVSQITGSTRMAGNGGMAPGGDGHGHEGAYDDRYPAPALDRAYSLYRAAALGQGCGFGSGKLCGFPFLHFYGRPRNFFEKNRGKS